MDIKKIKWLSKKIDDKEAFYEFITTNDINTLEYIATSCYKKRYVNINMLFSMLVNTINNEELISHRTLSERKNLIDKALDVYKFPHSKLDDIKFKMLIDMVTNEELLNIKGSSFMGSMGCQLLLMDEVASTSFPLNNEGKIKLMYAKKIVASSKLTFREKLEFISKISLITDSNEARLESKVYDIHRIVSNDSYTSNVNLCNFLFNEVINDYDSEYGKSYNSSILTDSKLKLMLEKYNNDLKETNSTKKQNETEEKIDEYLDLMEQENKTFKRKLKK